MTHYIEVVAAARETVAKMLTQRTGQKGLNPVVTTNGGKTAAAVRQGDYCRVDLPSLAPDTVLTRTEADRMIAYLVHEVCHMLHTDYAAWGEAVALGTRVKHWTNALEDVRIEAHEMKVGPYKAMRNLLSGLVSHLYADAHNRMSDQGGTLGHSFLNAPYIVTILGRAQNGYDLPITATLAGSLSPNVRMVTDLALSRVKTCRSTWDCLALAKDLVALEQSLKAQEPKQPDAPKPQQPQPQPQPQPGQNQEGDQESNQEGDQGEDMRQGDQGEDQGKESQGAPEKGSQGEQEPDQDSTEEDEGDQGGHGEGDIDGEDAENADQGEKGDQGEGQGEGSGDENSKGGQDDDAAAIDPDLNLGNTAQTIMDRTGDEANPYDASHKLNSMTATRKKARDMFRRSNQGDAAAQRLKDMTPANGVLHGQIARLLVSEARNARTHHETSGRLDRRALVRMRTGAQDVFTRRDYAPGVDTAVLVLIDLSGSMGSRIALAQVTAWAMANAAESAGGNLAIAGFKGGGTDTTLHYVKDWSMTANQCAGMLCSLIPNHSTPLSASVIAGAQDLSEVTATRRIMLVLTDGGCDLGASAVLSACRLAVALGVEVVGLGMQCPTVVKAFPPRYSVNVEDLNQLATTGLGTLTRMLEEAGPR